MYPRLMILVCCACYVAIVQERGPYNMWEVGNSGEKPWCWIQQVWNETFDGDQWLCLRCHSEQCVQRWVRTQEFLSPVSMSHCRLSGFFSDER